MYQNKGQRISPPPKILNLISEGFQDLCHFEENVDLNKADELQVYYINDDNLNSCPHVDVSFGLDSGSEKSIISEKIYDKLIEAGVPILELSLQNVVLVIAFGNRTRRIRKQAYLEFKIGDCF
jgi:hypothetical protein